MKPAAWRIWTALGLVYVFWGSTYLGIRYLVDGGLPPLLTAGVRYLLATLLLAAYLAVRRGRAAFRATPRQWLTAAGIGVLLLTGGNGGVTLAESRHLPSGLAALLVAGVPLYVVVLRALASDRPSARTVLGVAIGFVGLAVLLLPGGRPDGVPLGAALIVVCSSLLWSLGSFTATRVSLPPDPLAATVVEMLGGAAGLLVAGLLRGEQVPTSGVRASALFALAYLVLAGSVVAFTAYSWLLGVAPVSKVSTYAYVNPVVAVALGALLVGEQVTTTTVLGGAVTVLAVVVVVSQESRRRGVVPEAAEGAEEAYVPLERQGRSRSDST